MSKIIEIPAFIDPHVHFRTPGGEYKEDFTSGSEAAYHGGVRYVLDMPNTSPATVTEKDLDWKIENSKGLKVKFGFQFGATNDNLEEIKVVEDKIKAIKVYFGSSTGNLLVNRMDILENITKATKKIITVHAEDEDIIQKNIEKYKGRTEPKIHSLIRDTDSAVSAVLKLLDLARKTGHPIYFCHISTKDEVDLIRKAKKEGLNIYAEVTPHHLFLDESAYNTWGNFVKVNPPLRTKSDSEALWEAINDGTIDTIGSDHAPHLPEEKKQDYWSAPSGMPGVETTLPLMLHAVNEGKLTLEKLIELTNTNPAKIFDIVVNEKINVNMDLAKEVKAKELHSKCSWSPYEGMRLKGNLII